MAGILVLVGLAALLVWFFVIRRLARKGVAAIVHQLPEGIRPYLASVNGNIKKVDTSEPTFIRAELDPGTPVRLSSGFPLRQSPTLLDLT